MNFDLSETQELFRSTAERFAGTVNVAAREKIRSDVKGYDSKRWTELAELGLLAIVAKEEQGGLDGSLNDLSVIAETLGENNAVDPWLENGALPILLLSNADENKVLKALLDGSKIAALAFSERDTRYGLLPKTTSALKRKDNTGFTLDGQKQLVMGGVLADYLLVTVNYDGGFSLFCLPADSAGISTQAYRLADGSQATTVSFEKVEVPIEAKLNLDFAQFQKIIAQICVLCSAEMLGLSQLLLNDTIAYVKQREQFDVPIGSFQSIQHGLVDCYSQLEQMRSMLYRTLLLKQEMLERDSIDDWRANVMGAKSFIAEGANLIARTAVQYHGAMGITDEVNVGHAMKRIIILARLFGDASDNLKQYLDVV